MPLLKDYWLLTKPRLNLLVLFSSIAGWWMAGRGAGAALAEFALALFTLAGGSAALNMVMERVPDARMQRTKSRPLPAGRLSPKAALVFGVALSLASMAWLWLRVNPLTALIGLATTLSYLLVYTPLKKVSSLSTVVGAVPGALPPVMGWTAASGGMSEGAVALFAILFLWQIPHFLAIAVMYAGEYENAGFKVMPGVEGNEATGRQMVLYSFALVPVTLWVYKLGLSGRAYFFSALLLGLVFTAMAFLAAKDKGRKAARRLLLTSVLYLPLLFAAMLADRV